MSVLVAIAGNHNQGRCPGRGTRTTSRADQNAEIARDSGAVDIHTAELCGADPFDYLVALQRHHQRVAEAPADWMPWSFAATLEKIGAAAASE
ncbi:MAG: hypothetical protein IPM29_17405 [Planctomycetes bacterium]|nr:hypothetical protein [Planctomycetota bacterium]